MNTIEETTILSPDDSEETCAKFVIDSVTKPYILSNIMTAGDQYTIHFFVKSESSGSASMRCQIVPVAAGSETRMSKWSSVQDAMPKSMEIPRLPTTPFNIEIRFIRG